MLDFSFYLISFKAYLSEERPSVLDKTRFEKASSFLKGKSPGVHLHVVELAHILFYNLLLCLFLSL